MLCPLPDINWGNGPSPQKFTKTEKNTLRHKISPLYLLLDQNFTPIKSLKPIPTTFGPTLRGWSFTMTLYTKAQDSTALLPLEKRIIKPVGFCRKSACPINILEKG